MDNRSSVNSYTAHNKPINAPYAAENYPGGATAITSSPFTFQHNRSSPQPLSARSEISETNKLYNMSVKPEAAIASQKTEEAVAAIESASPECQAAFGLCFNFELQLTNMTLEATKIFEQGIQKVIGMVAEQQYSCSNCNTGDFNQQATANKTLFQGTMTERINTNTKKIPQPVASPNDPVLIEISALIKTMIVFETELRDIMGNLNGARTTLSSNASGGLQEQSQLKGPPTTGSNFTDRQSLKSESSGAAGGCLPLNREKTPPPKKNITGLSKSPPESKEEPTVPNSSGGGYSLKSEMSPPHIRVEGGGDKINMKLDFSHLEGVKGREGYPEVREFTQNDDEEEFISASECGDVGDSNIDNGYASGDNISDDGDDDIQESTVDNSRKMPVSSAKGKGQKNPSSNSNSLMPTSLLAKGGNKKGPGGMGRGPGGGGGGRLGGRGGGPPKNDTNTSPGPMKKGNLKLGKIFNTEGVMEKRKKGLKMADRPTLNTLTKKEILETNSTDSDEIFDMSFESDNNEEEKNQDKKNGVGSKTLGLPKEIELQNIAKKEKNIIKELLTSEYGASLGVKYDDRDVHHINRGNVGPPLQKKYLISAKWWREWRDFVKFDDGEDNGSMSPKYKRPGSIDNKYLLQEEDCIDEWTAAGKPFDLKENLLEHHDFEAVTKHVYLAFYQWYGSDFEITRMLRRDPSDPTQCYLDLYPDKKHKRSKSRMLSPKNPESFLNEYKIFGEQNME